MTDDSIDVIYPIPLGSLPMGNLSRLVAYECPQWFLIDIPDEKDQAMKDFLGSKYGSLYSGFSEGMLGNIKNITEGCTFHYENQSYYHEQVYTPFFRQTVIINLFRTIHPSMKILPSELVTSTKIVILKTISNSFQMEESNFIQLQKIVSMRHS